MVIEKIKSILLAILAIALLQTGIVVFLFTVADFWPPFIRQRLTPPAQTDPATMITQLRPRPPGREK